MITKTSAGRSYQVATSEADLILFLSTEGVKLNDLWSQGPSGMVVLSVEIDKGGKPEREAVYCKLEYLPKALKYKLNAQQTMRERMRRGR